MASERQMRANRLNAEKSTGPRTSEGKLASSQNALRHGLTSVRVVLDGEDATLYEAMRRDLLDEFKPVTALQMSLVQQLAGILWRLRRASTYEPALMTWFAHIQSKTHDDQGVMLGQTFLPIHLRGVGQPDCQGQNVFGFAASAQGLVRTGRTLEAAFNKGDFLGKLSRYEAHLVRQLEKILLQIVKQEVAISHRRVRIGQ